MTSISDLRHVTRPLPRGGQVLVLNTGALITPEAEAMLQAFHSRSVGGVLDHLEKLKKSGSDKFMSTFYVGYGHASIGDCGSITIFIEGVSILAAKAIQDWRLYSGQESSTRYIDFSKQPFIDPLGFEESLAVLEAWRHFYLKGLKRLTPHLQERFPIKDGEVEARYAKAIKAYAFDVMRGFLPAAATTNLAWHSNLRQVRDKLAILRHHPLVEVRAIADTIELAVYEAFPSSFDPSKRYSETEEFTASWSAEETYFTNESPIDFALTADNLDRKLLTEARKILTRRPPKTELPKHLDELGTVRFEFMLDFGSFRDLQRHRAVSQRMPLLTVRHGFHPWYLDELPQDLRAEAVTILQQQEEAIGRLNTSAERTQYYLPMGYNLPNRLVGSLPALVYIVELRATRFVHPTLRMRAQQMAQALKEQFGDYGLVLHLDNDPGRFDVQRGDHDIVEREQT